MTDSERLMSFLVNRYLVQSLFHINLEVTVMGLWMCIYTTYAYRVSCRMDVPDDWWGGWPLNCYGISSVDIAIWGIWFYVMKKCLNRKNKPTFISRSPKVSYLKVVLVFHFEHFFINKTSNSKIRRLWRVILAKPSNCTQIFFFPSKIHSSGAHIGPNWKFVWGEKILWFFKDRSKKT